MAVGTAQAGSRARQVPGWPVLGPVLDVHRDLLRVYERAHRECGDVARLVTGVPPLRRTVHLVMHPDGVRQVLAAGSRGYGKDSPVYEELRAFVGSGLLTSQDADWERQKRMLQPLFTPRRVAGYAGVMAEEADLLVDSWRGSQADGDVDVDLHHGSNTYTLRVVGRLLFGKALDDILDTVESTFVPIQRHVMFRGLTPVRLPRHWPTPGGIRTDRHRQTLLAAVDAILDRPRRPADSDPAAAEPEDLVSVLLRAHDPVDGSPLSRDEVRDQALVFVLAGQETTALALTYTFHLLGGHPEVQERVRAEAESCANPVTDLPYTRQVVHEAMRLYPPAVHIGRSARHDDTVLGARVCAGDPVIIPTWVVHRDERWWPDPVRFDPERFTPEATSQRHRYAYLPFGGGPRSCIGSQFAMLEASIAVATAVRAYSVRTPSTLTPLYPGITLRPRGPVPARLTPA